MRVCWWNVVSQLFPQFPSHSNETCYTWSLLCLDVHDNIVRPSQRLPELCPFIEILMYLYVLIFYDKAWKYDLHTTINNSFSFIYTYWYYRGACLICCFVFLQTAELGSWEEQHNAWDDEADEDLTWEADNVIREQRKLDRQQRQLEHQRRKQEREHRQAKSQSQLSAVRLSWYMASNTLRNTTEIVTQSLDRPWDSIGLSQDWLLCSETMLIAPNWVG